MAAYVKKIHIDKETGKHIILAAKNTNGPGHHLIELTDTLENKTFSVNDNSENDKNKENTKAVKFVLVFIYILVSLLKRLIYPIFL